MAIAALYPSRRQSRWVNPLFRRPRLRRVRRAVVLVVAVAVTLVAAARYFDPAQPLAADLPASHETSG